MKLRVFAGLLCLVTMSSPALADGLSPWGVWTDGAQLRKSKQPSALGLQVGPNQLGMPPDALAALKLGKPKAPVELASGGARPDIAPEAPETVPFDAGFEPGEVVIDTSAKTLYYIISSTEAFAYPIAVGKEGFTWTGTEQVSKIVDWPDWVPPDDMRQRKPFLPIRMTGGVRNPLGAKAIYLGNSLYRIHGTNDAQSIGTAASSGCFRMHNAQVLHLASLIKPGTTVHVVKSLPAAGKDQRI